MFKLKNFKPFKLLTTLRDQQAIILHEVMRLKELEEKVDIMNKQLKLNNREMLHVLQDRATALKVLQDYHRDNNENITDNYMPACAKSFDEYLNALRQLNPKAFPVWWELFENAKRSYMNSRHESCSMHDNSYAQAFHSFFSLHGRGRVLDIGSGIYGLPVYLSGYPRNLISAVEPLELMEPANFEVVQGFAEFMPWPNGSFNTILSATSLDHVLCLETALQEIHRVISPKGRFLIWIGAVPGAKPFDPQAETVTAIDDFHLFHFDSPWFEEAIDPLFSIKEKLVFPTPSFDHVFYCLNPRDK